MAYGYVDAHRLIRYRGGQARDITAFAGDLQAVDELGTLSVELSFGVIVAPWDQYVEKNIVVPGDKLRVVNHDLTVFSGQVESVTLDGGVTAYDRGWYLNKSQIILQVTGMPGDEAIRQACAKAGVGVASICSLPTRITQVWLGDTPADILGEILETVAAETGKQYQYFVRDDGLVVQELPAAVLTAYHKPADNLPAFNITWALGQVSGEDSIAELRNAVVIAAEGDGKAYIGAQAKNAASVEQYGFLQHIQSVTSNPGTAQLKQMVQNLLSQLDRVGRTRTIGEIWGCDEVKSGVVLDFNSPAFGISGKNRVTRVTHHYGGAGHTMELEIEALEEPRAAGTTDTVSVYGLPDNIGTGGSSDGVTTGGASGSAAAFVSTAMSQVGYREGAGNNNKYGAWFGMNNVAWCVIFVCWCAAQSGAPIPTKFSYVGDMSSYFQSRGLYRTVASGYIPKAGDLMIQGDRHIGIVRSATRAAVQTVEGNYSDSVATVTRYYSEISGFCTPWG
ncbi:MAG TPA: hypothetical protein H9745_03530 [Candidatus Agathobaculum stercoravium]|nr:hypothetical protein [Candidatus Agathobaculum stercoravium]